METITRLSNFYGRPQNQSPQSTYEKIKLVKKDLNSYALSKSEKTLLLEKIEKAELALNRNMEVTAETLLSQIKRDLKTAVSKKRILSHPGVA
jgi:hypothetical protein